MTKIKFNSQSSKKVGKTRSQNPKFRDSDILDNQINLSKTKPDHKPMNKIEQHIFEPNYTPKNKIKPPKLSPNYKPKNKIELTQFKPDHKPINKIEIHSLPSIYSPKNEIKPYKIQPHLTPKNRISPLKSIFKNEPNKSKANLEKYSTDTLIKDFLKATIKINQNLIHFL